jgi:phospholipid-binding lipoprotein MlaA
VERSTLRTGLVLAFTCFCLLLSRPAAAADTASPAGSPPAAGSTSADDYEDEYADDEKQVTVADPLQQFNRDMYTVNDALILHVLEPAAKAEKAVVPWEFRTIVRNMFQNIRFPVRFVNALLQAKWEKASDEFACFFLNTTVGILGMADVASNYPGIQKSPEDMGQTFAVWGWQESAYLTLPVLGPSTMRDALGKVPDLVLDPLFWLIEGIPLSLGVRAGEVVNATTFRIGDYEAIKKASIDPYVAIRNGYVQNRKKLIGE